MGLQKKDIGTLKPCNPRITKLVWNLVDKPWDFYSIKYVLDDYTEHVVYIPAKTIATELETMSIEEIIVAKLRATLDCVPEHVDRVTKEMKDESKRSAIQASGRSAKRKMA